MLLLSALLVLMFAVFVGIERRRDATWHRWAALGAGAAAVLVMAVGLATDLALQKTAGLLAMPAGLLWMALLVRASWRTRRAGRRAALPDWLFFLAFTLTGSPYLGTAWLQRLEAPYPAVEVSDVEPVRAVFVLGGGTKSTSGQPELSDAGDRVALAARLLHTGKTGFLVASGRSIEGLGSPRSMAEETAQIWSQLGVEDRRIVEISSPRNTKEEVQQYLEMIRTQEWAHVGVVSSAWHLPRVMRHFEGTNVQVTPLAADHRGTHLPWVSTFLIPQSLGFQSTQHAAWETLGRWVGR